MSAACPVCSGREAKALGAKGGFDYLRCTGCGLVFSATLPTPEQYAASYGEYTAFESTPFNVFRKTVKLIPLVLTGKMRSPGGRPLKFLDIGSNTGYNTEAARRLGCEAHGLETNPGTIAMARRGYPRCTFHEETIEQLATRGLKFDVVYCSEVLEHVPDPQAFMGAIAAVSLPHTTLFLTTPDSAHFKVPADVLAWKEVIPVQHLRLYDRANLTRLLAAHGFRIDFQIPMPRANLRLFCSRAQG